MHHIGVRFFDLVKKHHRIWPATYRLGQLATLLITNVAWGRTNQTRSGKFFHVLRHVDLNQCVRIAEHEFGKRAGEICLANASWTQKDK
jgi:hypothetical protein